jgi:hypothetical protein
MAAWILVTKAYDPLVSSARHLGAEDVWAVLSETNLDTPLTRNITFLHCDEPFVLRNDLE